MSVRVNPTNIMPTNINDSTVHVFYLIPMLCLCYSVMKFVEDAEEDCTKIVDSLLDVLTKGQHTVTMKQIQQVCTPYLILFFSLYVK